MDLIPPIIVSFIWNDSSEAYDSATRMSMAFRGKVDFNFYPYITIEIIDKGIIRYV